MVFVAVIAAARVNPLLVEVSSTSWAPMIPADVEDKVLSAVRSNVPEVESADEAPLTETPMALVSRKKADPAALAISPAALVKKRELVPLPTEPAVEFTVNEVVATEAVELLVMSS